MGQPLKCPSCWTAPHRYYLDLHWKGERLRIFSDSDGFALDSWERSERLLNSIRHQIDSGKFDPREYVSREIKNLRFDNYVQAWLDRQIKRSEQGLLAREYVRKLKGYVQNYLIPALGTRSIKDILEGHLEDFWLSLPGRLSLKTRHHILTALRKIFSDAFRRRDIGRIPDFPKVELDEPEIRVITEDDQERILAQIKCLVRHAFFLFLIRTGCRHNEARALRWERVDLKAGVAGIAAAMDGRFYRESTKEKDKRLVPLTDDLIEALRKLPRNLSGFVFTLNGRPLTINMIWRTWSLASAAVGIKISPYQGTRHSLATQLLNEGVNEKHIQKLLGHKTRHMMDKYAKMHVETLRQVLQNRQRQQTVSKIKIEQD